MDPVVSLDQLRERWLALNLQRASADTAKEAASKPCKTQREKHADELI